MAADQRDQTDPLIDHYSNLESYYHSLEARIGYRLVLGGTRHFGYYEPGTTWPFPIWRALRAMENRLFCALNLSEGAQVLDAGCGIGHVALYMARRGLRVTAIDILDYHLAKARRNVARERLPPGQVTVQKMDYHHLEAIPDASHDGVYTIETFVHAAEPETVLAGFFRLLKPGGRLALFEYDNVIGVDANVPRASAEGMHLVNKYSAMPTFERSHPGVYTTMLEDAGFVDVKIEDYTANVLPMMRLFYCMAIIPYFFIRLLGLERFFVSVTAGVHGYLLRDHCRYVAVTAKKPGPHADAAKTK